MFDKAQFKLREAAFFHARLAEESKRVFRAEPEALHFYLSAFLSAARSVTWALQAEAKQEYDAWFQPWSMSTLSDEERELMGFLKNQRNLSEKRGSPDVSVTADRLPLWMLQRELEAGGGSIQISGGVPGEPQPQPRVTRTQLSFHGSNETDVVGACGRHLELLHRVVEAFICYCQRPNKRTERTREE